MTEGNYARQITPLLFSHIVEVDGISVPGSVYDGRIEMDKIRALLTSQLGEAHNMFDEHVEPGSRWICAMSDQFQFMWKADAERFRTSLVVVREQSQYDSYSSGCDRTFKRFGENAHNDPPELQFTVKQCAAWAADQFGHSQEEGQRWTHAGYIFMFENPENAVAFKLKFV